MKQNRKRRAAGRIASIQSKLDSDNSREHLQDFLTDYIICEMACKEMIVGYRDSIGKPIRYEDVKMNMNTLKPALALYGISITNDEVIRLFSSDSKSAKKLRDSLVHGISKTNIDNLNKQYSQMQKDMKKFMNAIVS